MNPNLEAKRMELYNACIANLNTSQKTLALSLILQSMQFREMPNNQKVEVFLALASFAERFEELNKEFGITK